MRYRPFGTSGAAISTLTLSLNVENLARGPAAAKDLIYTALEAGINSYRLETADPVLAEVVGEALCNVERQLLNVSLELGTGDGRKGTQRDFSAEGMTAAIDRCLHISGLGWIDVALLQEPGENELSQNSLTALKALRSSQRVRFLGVSGAGDVMDAYISTGAFDVLGTPFHVNVDWKVRARVRAAREQDMAILAYDFFPSELATEKKTIEFSQPKKGLFGFGGTPRVTAEQPARINSFAFLHRTNQWTAEAICLAHVMSDPAISSVLFKANTAERLNVLASVPERDMPPGLAAQIEMARIAA